MSVGVLSALARARGFMLPHEHSSVLASVTTTPQATHREFILTIFCPAFLHYYRAAEEAPALAATGPEATRYPASMRRRGKDHRLRAARPLRTGRDNTPAGLNPAKFLIIRSTARKQRLFCVFFSPIHEKGTARARLARPTVFRQRRAGILFRRQSDATTLRLRAPRPIFANWWKKNAIRHCAKRPETSK
jgi:hypothetical protein